MVEMEIVKDIKQAADVQSTAEAQEMGLDSSTSNTPNNGECTHHKNCSLTEKINSKELQQGDVFYGTIKTKGSKCKSVTQQGIFMVCSSEQKGKNGQSKEFTLKNIAKQLFKVCSGAIKIIKLERNQYIFTA